MALMDIWYEQHYLDDWDDDYSYEEYYDTEYVEENSENTEYIEENQDNNSEVDSEITQNDSEYQLYSDYCQEFIQKLTNEK